MARGDYTPEIKASIADSPKGRLNKSPPKPSPRETPADVARDKQQGIAEGSAQDQKLDALPANQVRGAMPARPAMPAQGAVPPDLHHINAAASIAHAILGGRGM